MKQTYRYLFGPVPSRRLGRSLGVDLTPFKTCTLDCVFCQLGRTTVKTVERREYVPTAAVNTEIAEWLEAGGIADHITLAGSGEPTLHAGFGDVLQSIRSRTDIPTVLLSNGTLFTDPAVREAAGHADIVKLSLSAWDSFSFNCINRPHPDLDFPRIVQGYQAFRKAFKGKLWLEVFLIKGTNSAQRDVERIAVLAETIHPDAIHLNTSVRPTAETSTVALPPAQMIALTTIFRPVATVIADFQIEPGSPVAATEETILAMLKRRPCSARQIADVFNMHINEVTKYIGNLLHTGQAQIQRRDDETYYTGTKQ